MLLNKDVKGGLSELKTEIEKSEEVSVSIPIIHEPEKEAKLEKELSETKVELEKVKSSLQKSELENQEWRSRFSGKSPEEVAKKLDDFSKGWIELQKELKESAKNSNINELNQSVSDVAFRFEKLGHEIGREVFPIFGTAVGGILGGAGGIIGGGTQYMAYFADKGMDVGGHVFEKSIEDGKEVYKVTLESGMQLAIEAGSGAMSIVKEGIKTGNEARKELKEFAESMASVGAEGIENWRKGAQEFSSDTIHTVADTAENWRKGWENIAGKAMDDTTDTLKELFKGGIGVEGYGLTFGVGLGKGGALEAKVEGKDEIISSLREELKNKNAEIESLRKQVENQAAKGQDNLLNVIEMMTKSRENSRPSSPTPPPYSSNNNQNQ